MAKTTLTVLLVEDSPDYAQLVQRWLSPKEDIVFALNWTDTLMAGLNRLSRGGVDAVLLDLGLPDSNGMETFTAARLHAPTVPIILLTGGDTESLALRMVQEGAQDYLVKSACTAEILVKAIQYAVVRSGSQTGNAGSVPPTDPTHVIGVLGAKGGVGVSTVACNLAVELRRHTDQKTLLGDLDVNAGLVSFLMNTETGRGLLDAVGNIQRLDLACWESIVSHRADLDILRSPGLFGLGEMDTEKVRNVLTLIRTFYRWIVLDLGRLTPLSRAVLDRVTDLFIVTSTSIPALYEAKRTIGAVMDTGFEADRLRLIVNHFEKAECLPGGDLDRVFAIPVYAKLPSAAQDLHEAWARGCLPDEHCDFRVQVANLARKLVGLPAEKPKGRVAQILSFAVRARRSDPGVSVPPGA